jgi:hypothetical protein
MSKTTALGILLAAIAAVPMEVFLAFGLWFSPGWANGWGIPKRDVWPAGLAVMAFVIELTTVVALGALASLSLGMSEDAAKRELSRIAFATWLSVGSVMAVVACIPVYVASRAMAVELWP